jgi:hypothetical protein
LPIQGVAVECGSGRALSFLTQLSNKELLGTVIGAVLTKVDVPPAPGLVMAEWTGGPVTSDPDTAKT